MVSPSDPVRDGRTATDDYSAFNDVWDKPEGGMHNYLFRFLTSPDATFQHIAVWTIVQLLESGGRSCPPAAHADIDVSSDPQLISNIRNSHMLAPHIRQLASSRASTPSSSVGTPHSYRTHSHSDQETETAEGQGEIQLLSRRILEFVDIDAEVSATLGATPSQRHLASSVGESVVSGRDHDELRKSVQNAFSSHGH